MPGELEDDAWMEGYAAASAEADEVVEAKDAYIAKQEWLILALMGHVDKTGTWDAVPADVRETLRDYV